MKKSMIAIVAVSMFGFSCSSTKPEQKVDAPVVEQPVKEMATPKSTEKKSAISHVFAGPNLMQVIVKKGDLLNLTAEQDANFAAWRKTSHPLIGEKVANILKLEAEIKALSIAKSPLEEIVAKTDQTAALRTEIATLKGSCHQNLKSTLNPEQWEVLIATYQADSPMVETPPMETLKRINPLPMYIQFIQGDKITLTDAQKASFKTFSTENHPKIMKLVGEIIALEKTLHTDALAGESLEKMLTTQKAIETNRLEFIKIKNHCRDTAIAQLDDTQWQTLVELAK